MREVEDDLVRLGLCYATRSNGEIKLVFIQPENLQDL